MAHGYRTARDQSFLARVGAFVLACTAALTLSFVGVVAFATGNTAGILDRIPYYVLGAALLFVASIVVFEQRRRDGRAILTAAATVAGVALVFLTLGGEGFVYVARNPSEALAAQQFLYLVAAGLIGTGIGYWGARHRQDVLAMLR